MFTYVLYLYCLTCSPIQTIAIHNIPVYESSSAQWADLNCKEYGALLTGELSTKVSTRKEVLAFECVLETKEF